jgi:hypothetical protein
VLVEIVNPARRYIAAASSSSARQILALAYRSVADLQSIVTAIDAINSS